MVSISDVGRITGLASERAQIRLALANLDKGGMITSMTIGVPSPPPEFPPPSEPTPTVAWVNTIDWYYPAQMIEAIRQQLNARLATVEQELQDLGVTDLLSPAVG